MASKRPSYVSIRARQRNIIEGIGTRDLTYKQAAKEFGVTRQELRRFRESKPKDLRRIYNRSPALRKLYTEGERPVTRQVLGIKRIRRYEFEEHILKEPRALKYPNSKQIGRMIQRIYYENNFGKQQWSIYTHERSLPNSIDDIKLLYKNGKLTSSQYHAILKEWREDYPEMSDAWYAKYADILEDYEED